MPNYVKNLLYLKGEKAEIEKLLEYIRGNEQEEMFDFNKVIPLPEELDIESSSILKNSFIVYSYVKHHACSGEFHKMIEANRRKNETPDSCLERLQKTGRISMALGRTAYKNKRKYGYIDWYYWCIDNWGTKWNAMDVLLDEDNTLCFDTAWSAPRPVIKKLAELFPAVSIVHKWSDEDVGNNTGHIEFENGKISFINLPADGSPEAYDLYEECWDTDLEPEYREEN